MMRALFLALMLMACIVAGCITPPSQSPTPTVTVTPAPATTSDRAHITFNYKLGTATQISGLQKASPGNLLYRLQVNVTSDKPVNTSQDWFWMEYKVNDSGSVHTSNSSISFIKYPSKVIGPGTGHARGELLFELPDHMAEGYPKPYYYMAPEEQQGPYKVYGKVYGTVGDV